MKQKLFNYENSFSIQVFNDFKVLTVKDSTLSLIKNHIGNFSKLELLGNKLFEENILFINHGSFAENFKCLIQATLDSISFNDDGNVIQLENQHFKVKF